jgi:hypothetical protein
VPGDSSITAGITSNLAGTTFQTILVAHSNMLIYHGVNIGWANRQAGFYAASLAAGLIDGDMALFFICFVFIQAQTGIQA